MAKTITLREAPILDRRFPGRDNAGLRRAIRDQIAAHCCGPENARCVRALARTVAFTAQGLATLELTALDCIQFGADSKPTCDCDACTAGSRQRLGANEGQP